MPIFFIYQIEIHIPSRVYRDFYIFHIMTFIDVFVRVQDNLWDIGFTLELIDAWKQRHPFTHIQIYTDNPSAFQNFLWTSFSFVSLWSELEYENWKHWDFAWFLFNFPIPESILKKPWTLQGALHFDYLAFDSWIVGMHWVEHICSSVKFPVHHIVNSPCIWGGGTLIPRTEHLKKEEWCDFFRTDSILSQASWVSVFMYPEGWEYVSRLLPENAVVWCFDASSVYRKEGNIHYLPYQSFELYQNLLEISDINIVRGEVSLVRAMHAWKPFLWDMYKEKWGWNKDEYNAFCNWMDTYSFDERYKEIMWNINQRTWVISWDFLLEYDFKKISKEIKQRNLIDTIDAYMGFWK